METNFPRCMKAGKALDLTSWELADALLKEADNKESGEHGLKAVVTDFANLLGLEYETRYLHLLRQAAETFPPDRRHDKVVLRAHVAAGNPDMLDVIVKAGRKDGKKITHSYIEAVLRRTRQEERERRKQEQDTAKIQAAEAEAEERQANIRRQHAKTDNDRKTAERQRDAARDRKDKARERVKSIKLAPPRKDVTPPQESEVSGLLAKTRFMADAGEIKRIIRRMQTEITPAIPELKLTFINAAVEDLLEAANSLRALADLLRQEQGNKRGHLAVVNE